MSPGDDTPSPLPGAAADLEEVFAAGFSRYQLVMVGTQVVRAIAYRSSLTRGQNLLNYASSGLAVAEAVRRHRHTGDGAATLSRVGLTVGSTGLLVAAMPEAGTGPVPRAVLWGHLPAQWVAAGVGIFERSPRRKAARLGALLAPLALQAGLRRSNGLAAFRTAAGFGSFVLVGEVLTRRLRAAADHIDDTVDSLVREEELLAQRMEEERIARGVLDAAADELSTIRDLITTDRAAAVQRASDEEALLRAWVSTKDESSLDAAPVDASPSDFGSRATESLDLAVRRAEMVLRLAGTLPLVIHATWTHSKATRLLAWLAALNALLSSYELANPDPRRIRITAGDLTTIGMATLLSAQQSHRHHGTGEYPSAEALIGYVASLAPCAGTVNADPELARVVTTSLAVVLGAGALLSDGTPGTRMLIGMERIAMTAGASWFSHWVRDVILDQTDRLSEATSLLARARAEAAAATARRWKQYLIHDSALQVLLWIQKTDLSDEQLTDWINREVVRLQAPPERVEGQRVSLAQALADLLGGFELLGQRPQVLVADDLAHLPNELVIVIIEILNEALTNVMKHSPDAEPLLSLSVTDDRLVVEVVNRCDDQAVTGRGTGYASMTERAGAVGGRVDRVHHDGRHQLVASLPLPVASAEPARSGPSAS